MNPGTSKLANPTLWLAVALTAMVVLQFRNQNLTISTPSPDNKAEQAYRRTGFGDKIMSPERRKQLTACYKEMLRNNGYDESRPTPKAETSTDKRDNFEGKVTFVFHVDEDGSLIDYELADSDFQDKRFSSCISESLNGVRFLPPPLGINRYIAHEFVFKSDETFKREMEEKKNQPPLTLVTPQPEATEPK
ncbi:MAG: hypothetical protein RI932_1698 [Pseudomonadota bacterium]|jgi:hypothetical protein